MQLVEVVRAPFTSEQALAQASGLAKRLGKFPLVVRDGPGFLVNRILSRYLAEAVILVGEGDPDPAHRRHREGLWHGRGQRTPHGASGTH